jgi:Carboxypeptidase regulatory-like domain
MQLGTIVLAGVCGVVGLVAGRASAPTGPIIIAAAPPPVAPVIVVAPTPAVEDPERADNETDDGDGTDVAEVLATLNEQATATPTPAGEVLGRITDWHDEPAVGCTVVAMSPNLVGEQVVITDEHGDYDITKLPPGYYSLTMYYNDNTFVRTDIAMREIEPTHFDVALSPPPRDDYRPPEPEEQEIVIISGVAPTDLDDVQAISTAITFSGSVALENGFK